MVGLFFRQIPEMLTRKSVTITLVGLALVLGIVSFITLSGGVGVTGHTHFQFLVFLSNFLVLILLASALVIRVRHMMMERRKGLAGARLHVRVVILFGVVSVIPTLLVGVFAAAFFHYGIQIWFNDKVSSALSEALEASRGYLQEHNANIRTEAFSLANFLEGMEANIQQTGEPDPMQNPDILDQILDTQATLRGLSEAIVYNPLTNKVFASGGLMTRSGYFNDLPPASATLIARTNEVAILDAPDEQTVRAVISLNTAPPMMLLISRPVDPQVLDHMHKTEKVVADYRQQSNNRAKIQFTFVLIFALVALLVLAAAILGGLVLANQIVRPLGGLMLAAERVRAGDLSVKVPEGARDDEVTDLSRAFNRMTSQLSEQHTELLHAYSQIDERRRFTEAVLSGVSAGVIGLDASQRIELPNRAASQLLAINLSDMVGRYLVEVVREFGPILQCVSHNPNDVKTQEIQIGDAANKRTLRVQVAPEVRGSATEGFVVTFDDITVLQAAERKAAWADVARRIAHEIKNPLTPIQLSAERLRRRFLKEITSDKETFGQCVDTIIRHVGDIGRMVDEFSAFARMPQPVMRAEDLSRIIREALILQKNAHNEIEYIVSLPDQGPVILCDRRLIGQALTNLLQNAFDAISMVQRDEADYKGGTSYIGKIWISLNRDDNKVSISIADDGVGLPKEDRARLTEPYITHKAKGTGLGLAIVKKIMEDHSGFLQLDDRVDGQGSVATLILPVKDQHGT
ncbi:sensor histidine kinase NtrY-like [Entomobacter blattae]|uniref:histidine kinase n=1 Tax=Entomobacter blattae TaxID=2762277 RepID=A0A7H1NT56_9PROT|nr:PAS domain-containing sensor histidine kinase [Entomobacter blattae]QNT78966.1 Adaptive-response sensory-kinase SasA [Entomobacter blattae]